MTSNIFAHGLWHPEHSSAFVTREKLFHRIERARFVHSNRGDCSQPRQLSMENLLDLLAAQNHSNVSHYGAPLLKQESRNRAPPRISA